MSRKPKFNGTDCVLVCDVCDRPIKRGGIGYACVDLLAATERGKDWENGDKRGEIPWHIYHQEHDPNLKKWNRPDYRIWATEIETFDALALKIADVVENFEAVIDTAFVGLIRRIIYDSKHYVDKEKTRTNGISETRKRNGLTEIGQELTKVG